MKIRIFLSTLAVCLGLGLCAVPTAEAQDDGGFPGTGNPFSYGYSYAGYFAAQFNPYDAGGQMNEQWYMAILEECTQAFGPPGGIFGGNELWVSACFNGAQQWWTEHMTAYPPW